MNMKRSFSFILSAFSFFVVLGLAVTLAFAELSQAALDKKALAFAPGTITSRTSGSANGKPVAWIHIKGSDGFSHQLTLDANTGERVEHSKHDTKNNTTHDMMSGKAYGDHPSGQNNTESGGNLLNKKPSLKKFGL